MSTDWHVYCRTCGDTHSFDDANHQEKLMWLLIDHASAIAGLTSLIEESAGDLVLKCYYGEVSPKWFKDHLGHDLIPISEYGGFGVRGAPV
jgi:hypothetical protein